VVNINLRNLNVISFLLDVLLDLIVHLFRLVSTYYCNHVTARHVIIEWVCLT